MRDLASKLISENKGNKSAFLDLGNCGLTTIPADIAELVWLESLTFASEWAELRAAASKSDKTNDFKIGW